mmetsp:Transcript_80606/g.121130  ORF Transcript_80606/g.121130 Transcript_80606/m.121130 type:complete len:239 (-) Transcript_80606:1933-2649(-)
MRQRRLLCHRGHRSISDLSQPPVNQTSFLRWLSRWRLATGGKFACPPSPCLLLQRRTQATAYGSEVFEILSKLLSEPQVRHPSGCHFLLRSLRAWKNILRCCRQGISSCRGLGEQGEFCFSSSRHRIGAPRFQIVWDSAWIVQQKISWPHLVGSSSTIPSHLRLRLQPRPFPSSFVRRYPQIQLLSAVSPLPSFPPGFVFCEQSPSPFSFRRLLILNSPALCRLPICLGCQKDANKYR